MPDFIKPYPVRIELPEPLLAAFRANPFALPPDAAAGAQLYQSLFSDREARSAAERLLVTRDIERQLVLRSDVDAFQLLADVPWEFLAASAQSRPFGSDPDLSLLRVVEMEKTGATLAPRGPLRIVHILCNDRQVGEFDDEAKAVHGKLTDLYRRLSPAIEGKSIGDPENVPSLDDVGETLGAFHPHVLFFMGHGRVERGRTYLRFTQWEPIETVVSRVRNATSDVAILLLVACNTAQTGGGWKGSLPTSHMGVPALLESGPAAVCAMQAAFSAINAVPFIDVFLRSMFRNTSLPAAFNHARRQSHWQGAFTGSSGWAVPLLFVNAHNVDGLLGLHQSLEAYRVAIRQQYESFAGQTADYVARAAVDAWLDNVLAHTTGLAILEADADAGSTTSLSAAARRQWEASRNVLAGEAIDADRKPGLPRPFFYADASAGGNTGLLSVLSAFGPKARQLIGGWNSEIAASILNRELNTVGDLVNFVGVAGACVVIDHAHALEPSARDELARRSAGLHQGAILLVCRPGDVGDLGTTHRRLSLFSPAECTSFALAHGHSEADGARWNRISEGRAHDLQQLASGLFDTVADGAGGRTAPNVESVLDRIGDRWPDVFRVAHFCALFPQGLCRRWLPSLRLPNEKAVVSAIELGLITEFTLEDLPWVRVAPRYGVALLKRERPRSPQATGEMEGDAPIEAAAVVLELLQRLTGTEEWLSSRAVAQRPLPIVQTYRTVAELLLQRGRMRLGTEIARAVYQAERPPGRHLVNEALMLTLLGAIKMSEWEAGDLLRLAVAAHGLGHTALHGSVLDYLDAANLDMTRQERITFLIQRTSFLKDTARTDAMQTIRTHYAEADTLATHGTQSDDPDIRWEFQRDSAVILYNWGVAERYFGDPPRALNLLQRSRDAYIAIGRTVDAAITAVERAGAELDLAGHVPDWPALERELVEQSGVLEAQGDSTDLAFARYQLARLYRKRSQPDLDGAAKLYLSAADIAGRVGNLRIQGAALKHYATVAAELKLVSAAEAGSKLTEAIVLLENATGDAWAARVRRDAWTARCALPDLRPDDQREAWRRAVETAMEPPLRPDRSPSDCQHLVLLFSQPFGHLIELGHVDRAYRIVFPDRAPSATPLVDLRTLARDQQ